VNDEEEDIPIIFTHLNINDGTFSLVKLKKVGEKPEQWCLPNIIPVPWYTGQDRPLPLSNSTTGLSSIG